MAHSETPLVPFSSGMRHFKQIISVQQLVGRASVPPEKVLFDYEASANKTIFTFMVLRLDQQTDSI